MTNRLSFGVIGAGIIGLAHIERLAAGEAGTELIAVADTVDASAQRAAKVFGVEALSVPAILERPDIDAVVICVPSGLHADVAIAALEAGKHVLLEKPIDVTVDAADRIIAAEARSGRVLTVSSQRRFSSENQRIKQLIDDGEFGRITGATVELPLWRDQEYYDSGAWRGTWALDGGGALMNQGVHLVDLSLWLLGNVVEVHAYTSLLAHERIEVEDVAAFVALTERGAPVTFLTSTAAYPELPIRFAVFGDKGSVIVEDNVVKSLTTASGEKMSTRSIDSKQMFVSQLQDFVTAIKSGGTPLVTSREARAAVALIEAVYESGRSGVSVKPR